MRLLPFFGVICVIDRNLQRCYNDIISLEGIALQIKLKETEKWEKAKKK